MSEPSGFRPPPYPYDRLAPIQRLASLHDGGAVDLSVGTPCDPPPLAVVEALAESGQERSYPPSFGSAELRGAAAGWFQRRLGVEVDPAAVAACVGTKELVVGVPHWLRLREPGRDTVLYPEVSYPSYAMGAILAGCRAVPVPVSRSGGIDLDSIHPDDARRGLCLWVNSPANPTGALDDLGAAAQWGRRHGVPVFSDECYVEFTWAGPGRGAVGLPGETVLRHGSDGVVSVQSLSKRSNLAGLRVGFYAGDADLVAYLGEVRKHSGLMVPGPAQVAGVAALGDDEHVLVQRDRYLGRLSRLRDVLVGLGLDVSLPSGGFYLWAPAPEGDAWALAEALARSLGVVVSPGEFYGSAASSFVRIAAVQPDDRIDVVIRRSAGVTGHTLLG